MQTRQNAKKRRDDANILKQFLDKNPQIRIAQPKVQLARTDISSSSSTSVNPPSLVPPPSPPPQLLTNTSPLPSPTPSPPAQLTDKNILQNFLDQNPNIKMFKPKVQLKAMSPRNVATQKFLLQNPDVKLKSARVDLTPIPVSAKTNLDKLQKHVDRENRLIRHKALHNMYYDPSHPASYGSAYVLYTHAKKNIPSLKYKQVENWLNKQRAHYLTKKVRKFERRPVLVRGVRHQYQADLMDFKSMANHNYHRRYILTVIDCFSRKAAAIPLLSKKGFPVQKALEKAFNQLGYPKKLQTDQGKEFFNNHVQGFLRRHNVAHFFTKQELKAQMVERFNRTLRDKIAKHIFSKDKESWNFMASVPEMVNAYNNKVHSALKRFTPNQVNKSNEAEVRAILYKDYFAKKKNLHKFQIGDAVRPIIKRPFYKKMRHTFKKGVHFITDVLDTHPPTYHIKGPDNVAVGGAFYEKQLQAVNYEE